MDKKLFNIGAHMSRLETILCMVLLIGSIIAGGYVLASIPSQAEIARVVRSLQR